MPNLPNGSKGGFEPGISRLRVRHSTTELSNCAPQYHDSKDKLRLKHHFETNGDFSTRFYGP